MDHSFVDLGEEKEEGEEEVRWGEMGRKGKEKNEWEEEERREEGNRVH